MELRTAMEAGVPIRPIIRVEDKGRIGTLMAPLKTAALADLGFIGELECLDFNRNDVRKFATDTAILLEDMPSFIDGWPAQCVEWQARTHGSSEAAPADASQSRALVHVAVLLAGVVGLVAISAAFLWRKR